MSSRTACSRWRAGRFASEWPGSGAVVEFGVRFSRQSSCRRRQGTTIEVSGTVEEKLDGNKVVLALWPSAAQGPDPRRAVVSCLMRTQVPLAASPPWSRRPGRHPGRACPQAALVARSATPTSVASRCSYWAAQQRGDFRRRLPRIVSGWRPGALLRPADPGLSHDRCRARTGTVVAHCVAAELAG